jgi:LPS O-antigen subunit length determinant protein (WzzB/FepE family)
MQHDNQQTYPYQADEIDLRKLAKSLKERRWFIFGFTGFVTLLAIVYVLLLPPPSISYIATTSFTKPSKSSFIINNDKILSVTRESIYSSFLDNIIIESLQKKVFTEGDYLSRLNKQNEPVGDVDKYISGFLNSASLEKKGELNTFSIQGANAEILTDFLNELVIEVNNEIVNEIKSNHKQKIAFGLDEIATQVKEINDQIDGLRYKAEQDRLNQILRLTEDVKLARSLGVIENNFTQSSDTLTTASLPNWYLYGEKALLARINILKSRTSDDTFIPELVTLNNKLNEVQNNKTLKVLEEHQDDDTSYSSFFSSLNALTKKKVKLESNIIDLDSSTINAAQVIKSASAKQIPIESRNKMIVAIALFGGFIFSIFLVLLANLFKEDETEPTTKNK